MYNANRRHWNVRFFLDEEKHRFFDAVESIGIPVPEEYRTIRFNWPRSTCTFQIDQSAGRIDYLRPFMGAAMIGIGARVYSVPEFCRLAELGFPDNTRVPVFHVPHDGTQLPDELMGSVCIPEERFLRYHEIMRDTDVWELVPREYRIPFQGVRFPVSRLVCDVERFIGPEEIMERYGMGFCYERAYDGTRIKTVDAEAKEKALSYYRKHHAKMDRICEKFDRIVLFDLHAFSEEIIPKDFLREGVSLPDVCIGADGRYTPPELVKLTKRYFGEAGFSCAVNYPYSGCFVPDAVLSEKSGCDLVSIMLEFNKNIYAPGGKTNAEKTQSIREILRTLAAEFAAMDGKEIQNGRRI